MASYLSDTNLLLRMADPTSEQHAIATQALARTSKEVTDLQERFPLLPDSPAVFTRWLDLVKRLPVHGKRVHDARLVAVLQTHAVEHLVTFNTADFAAFSFLSLIDPHLLVNAPGE